MSEALPPAIGIDLGTTCCCVAVYQHNKVNIIGNEQGFSVTPSYAAFNQHERLTGDAAKEQLAQNPTNTIFDVKRLIGRRYDDPVLQNYMKKWPFLVKNVNANPKIEIMHKGERKCFAPEEISAMLLTKMKQDAEKYLNVSNVTNVVITVPAYFNNTQRQATYDAGLIAGLNVMQVLNEPTAAAIAYGIQQKGRSNVPLNILVFDFGGGTLDVTVLMIDGDNFIVKSTSGDTNLGGADFDERIIELCMKELQQKQQKHTDGNVRAHERLRIACERSKRILSSADTATIIVDGLFDGNDFSMQISRTTFQNINIDLFRRALEPVKNAVADANLTKADINHILMVGGSSRIPKVQAMLTEYFPGAILSNSINPEEAVASGAAIHAAILAAKLAKDDNTDDLFGILLKDVTPLSLGIQADKDDSMCRVIDRNTTIPCSQSRIFTTVFDDQREITFRVIQGENYYACENHFLGEFTCNGIPKGPAGRLDIPVKFIVDENGILKVTARNPKTRKTSGITIQKVCGKLRKEEMKRMKKDAEIYREEDRLRRLATKSNEALQQRCYDVKYAINEISMGLEQEAGANGEILVNKCDDVLQWAQNNPYQPHTVYDIHKKTIQGMVDAFSNKHNVELI